MKCPRRRVGRGAVDPRRQTRSFFAILAGVDEVKIAVKHSEEHLDDVIAGYGTGVDLDQL